MRRAAILWVLAFSGGAALVAADGPARHAFAIGEESFLLDGRRFQIRCGEVHAPRVPHEYWRHRLKMVKAMGLNAVCAYLFWNLQEPRPGEFAWSGQADAAEFCKIAQEEGLWVLLRPGPYACAEWEMGGLPWWLLGHGDIKLRTRDPRFLSAATRYLKEVGRVLGPLQVSRGGPILMVQVENEYGFFGKDAEYMGAIRAALVEAGFEVPLFACNPPGHLRDGYRADLFPVVNFGSDPAGGFRALRQVLPKGPLMCGEFYPGWFDTWGAPHHRGDAAKYLADLEFMLKAGGSFSIYMAHGGTSFGLWSGADRPFKPDTSSYDYDAPITEAGWATDKFRATRDLMAKYLLPGESIPEPPARNPVIAIAAAEAAECAPVFANLPTAKADAAPRTMEEHDQGYGAILYRTILPAGPAGAIEAAAVHDFGYVFLDGRRVGVLDRRGRRFRVVLHERKEPAVLDILVEAMGRVNFGAEVHDRKGLHGPVRLSAAGSPAVDLTGWQVFPLPLDGPMLAGLKYAPASASVPAAAADRGPAFWRASLDVETPGDTFLDVRTWGKGVAWVNGRCLGRFWNIGPTQTMYVPGPWLKAGRNEVVILDYLGPEKPVFAGRAEPILDELRPALDFAKGRRPLVHLALEHRKPAMEGRFPAGPERQDVHFPEPRAGRFFCIESIDAHDGKPFAAIAELVLLDPSGSPLNQEGWRIAHADSEETSREDGSAENAIDGQAASFWHTEWGDGQPGHPHRLVIDLGRRVAVAGFRYLPRPGDDRVGGRIKGYRVYVDDGLAVP
ncbi:Beta-galactosidase precursor [Aquisphaera giovannonii]|uniref:Beta-galactosidase n=1 Tax=Aquisphaera giovannonii TaxID=406548 RepID=A0A5B9WCR9_9BACT|nr:beta-galactosidase [Aquisphaera giovannonii]QEH38317.1 Beta-galactosidase precursor [Aquisphaera giovannonii]